MSYQVLARKWRPRNFKEMVGQEHVLRALINALDNDRLHHAFLFTGTRGVGKTTISRILAKSLNCDQGVSSSPCGVCSSCKEIDDGRFVDLIEVDAASRTKVEDTRELLENVQYAPTRGRYKVYLIDEVHMLSTHSFNALLKTLEEPPPHVKFLLATTDPQKLPVTILSRCLQFSLRRLTQNLIANHLQHILQQEQFEFEPEALSLIALAADGSMRDGLSLLDQAIAYGGGKVLESETRGMLGTIDRQHVFNLLEALSQRNALQLMANVEQLSTQAPDYQTVCAEILSCLQRIAMVQMVPDSVSTDEPQRNELEKLAQQMTPEEVQLYYQIALHMRRDLPLAPDSRGGLEMGLLRMLAFCPASNATQAEPPSKPQAASQSTTQNPAKEVLASVKKPLTHAPAAVEQHADTIETSLKSTTNTKANGQSPAAQALAAARGVLLNKQNSTQEAVSDEITTSPTITEQPIELSEALPPTATEAQTKNQVSPPPRHDQVTQEKEAVRPIPYNNSTGDYWAETVDQLEIGGLTRQLAMHCVIDSQQADSLTLLLTPSHEQYLNSEREQQLQQALSQHLGSSVRLTINIGASDQENPMQLYLRKQAERQHNAELSIQNDPHVHKMQHLFSAEVNPESIHPIAS